LSGASFCGTCFMQTRIFKSRTPSQVAPIRHGKTGKYK
jgi:hypothetical protein